MSLHVCGKCLLLTLLLVGVGVRGESWVGHLGQIHDVGWVGVVIVEQWSNDLLVLVGEVGFAVLLDD